jgi:hypothetical protein
MSKYKLVIKKIALLGIAGLLSSCGGGGGGGSSPTTTTPTTQVNKTVSGSAAAGAPIVGIVNIKGANGGTASSNIDSDGLYSIDISNIDAPYILFAEGSVNGRSLTMYSATVAAGTVNITPITDFILRNALAVETVNMTPTRRA